MLTGEEIRRGLSGAWRLFMGDKGGLGELDTSYSGFWRSFLVVVPLLPFYVVFFIAERRTILEGLPDGAPFDDWAFGAWRALSVALDWIIQPLVLAILAKPLGFASRYVPLIVAFNWGGAIIMPVSIPLMIASDLLGDGLAALLLLVSLVLVVIRLVYVMARTVLDEREWVAAGIVTLTIALAFVIDHGITSLSGY